MTDFNEVELVKTSQKVRLAISEMFKLVGAVKKAYKNEVIKAMEIKDESEKQKSLKDAYKKASERYESIMKTYKKKISPDDYANALKQGISEVAIGSLVLAVEEAISPPINPNKLLIQLKKYENLHK